MADDRTPEAPQHPARRLRPGAAAVLAARRRLPAVAGPAPGRGPRVHRLLHPLLALLPQPGQPVHRSLPRGPRGARQRDHARARRAAHLHPDPRLPARRGRLPLVLHRQVAPLPLPHAGHGGLRVRRLGRQRPPLHGMGRHRCPLRPAHRLQRRPLADRERRPGPGPAPPEPAPGDSDNAALVPDRGPGQPPRRDVVPGGPARLPGAPPRRRGRHPPGAGVRRLEGRRPPPHLHRSLPRGGRPASRPTSTTTSTPSPRPTGSGGGTSSTGCGVTSTRPTRGPGCATSTTTSTSTSWPTAAWARCSPPSRRRGRGTTPSSSSPPTTATCAAPTGSAPRAPSSTTRSCGCPSTSRCPA